MKFPIIWASEKIPSSEEYSKYVEPNLEKLFQDLNSASQLIFHTIFVGEGVDGPIVMAYGKDEDDSVYLDYIPEVEWFKSR